MYQLTQDEKLESIDLLNKILSIPTVNDKPNELALASFLQQYFQSYGIESQLHFVIENRGNLIVDIEGNNKNELIVWNGHLDTVPYGRLEEWDNNPEIPFFKDDRIYARGASDMKSGLAAMVSTICLMCKANKKPLVNIRFLATCDEEKNGLGAKQIIKDNMLGEPNAIIIGEPTDLNIGIAQKGCLWIELSIRGKTSHGAYPSEGVNAVQYGTEVCMELSNFIREYKHPILKGSTAEITYIKGGIATNMIPDNCKIIMDIRYTPELLLDTILKKLKEISMKYHIKTDGDLQIDYKILNHRIGNSTSQDNHWVLALHNIINSHEIVSSHVGVNYFTDASILLENKLDIPVILFGPGSSKLAHKANEYIDINKYYKAIEILSDAFWM